MTGKLSSFSSDSVFHCGGRGGGFWGHWVNLRSNGGVPLPLTTPLALVGGLGLVGGVPLGGVVPLCALPLPLPRTRYE